MPVRESNLVTWLSSLTITQGRHAGESITLLPWQRRFVTKAFKPGVRTAALSVGRGNGKTTLIGELAAAALDGPLRQPRAEVVIVASSFDQGRICYEHVRAFLQALHDGKLPRSDWRTWDTVADASIEHRESGARVRAIGSDPRRAHGRAPLLAIDIRYSVQVGRPERGLSPLTWASRTASLAGNLEQRQSEETGSPVGSVLPVPADGAKDDPQGDVEMDDPLTRLRADLAGMKGRPMLVESSGSWANASGLPAGSRQTDIWQPTRIGGEVPESHVGFREQVTRGIAAACGVPAELLLGSDATAAREAWRRFVFGVIAPSLRVLESETRIKLGTPGLTLDPSALAATDLVSRTRAVGSLVTAKVPVEKALKIAGLSA